MPTQFKSTTIETLKNKGLTSASDDKDLRKAYFSAAGAPIKNDNLPLLKQALDGDASLILTVEAAAPTEPKAKKEKAVKAPKAAKEPKAAAAPKVAETPEAALARMKADPKTQDRWRRVVAVTEMGKRGPTRVRILCDDKGEGGADLFREIAVQDLFQVRFSAGYAKKVAKSGRNKSKAKAAAQEGAATAEAAA